MWMMIYPPSRVSILLPDVQAAASMYMTQANEPILQFVN